MDITQPLYIAGMGVISSLGDSVEKTSVAVQADMSAYKISDFFNKNQQAITVARVPEVIFTAFDSEIDEGNVYSEVYDHIIKMSIIALRETFSQVQIKTPVPLILALPESNPAIDTIPLELLTKNLLKQSDLPIDANQIRSICTGRAGVIQSLALAQKYLYEANQDYVVIGGSDSYLEYPLLQQLAADQRLTAIGTTGGFAPGEGAGFILVTRHASFALKKHNKIIALQTPGVGQELGYIKSEETYKGDGLHESFKQALSNNTRLITTVYSSMNGENYWAKENGVAMLRNKKHFVENVKTQHPTDSYGDLGCATGAVLIALSASELFNEAAEHNHLVYTSSDNQWRASVVINKIHQSD